MLNLVLFLYSCLFTGAVYSQHSIPYKQQMPNVGAFGQQSSLAQLGQLPTQIPVTNQIPVNQNQILANSSSIGAVAANPLSNCLHMGQMNQLNGVPNAATSIIPTTMPPQMVRHDFSYDIVEYTNNHSYGFMFKMFNLFRSRR